LDGCHLRPLDDDVARHRRKMNFSGVAVITLVIDRHGVAADDPQVTLLGIDDEKTLKKLRNALSDAILDEMDHMPRSTLLDDTAMRETVRRISRRYLRQEQGKKPIVEVHLVRV
ncbi:MAG: MBL fold metallo-hydrolase, partial [Bdellovibrionales bacterium]